VTRRPRAAILLLAVVLTSACAAPGSSGARTYSLGSRQMTDCVAAGSLKAKCGALTVPENRADPKGRQIDIQVDLIPAQEPGSRLEPVCFIAGGPGGSTIHDWAWAPMVFPGLNRRHDIVLVDQRGTGGSHAVALPPMTPGESLPDYARRALAGLDGDPRYYTTAVAMDDLDAVRQALGYEKIDLYGASYGATAVQYYMRQHAAHAAMAVLDGGTLLDVPILELIAANSQKALDNVLDRCAAEPACAAAYPHARTELAAVLNRLNRAPVKTTEMDPNTAEPILITHDLFAGVLHDKLLTAAGAATIPWLVHRAWSGDFGDVLPSDPGPATQTLVMGFVIRCTEAWARFDPDQVRLTGAGSYYLSAQLAAAREQAAGCPLMPRGIVPPDDAVPLRSTQPVLLLAGANDPQDPPSNVADAGAELPNSVTVVVPYQGHTVGHIECLPGVVVDFFDSGKADMARASACTSTLPAPAFRLG
jgi:pimeloyl-ACP methyl ester carboxylesterase